MAGVEELPNNHYGSGGVVAVIQDMANAIREANRGLNAESEVERVIKIHGEFRKFRPLVLKEQQTQWWQRNG